MVDPHETGERRPRPPDEASDRYLDLWDRNQSEIARSGPPAPPPSRPG